MAKGGRKTEPRYTPEKLEQLATILDSQLLTAAALVYPDCIIEDEDGERIIDNRGALLEAAAIAVDLRDAILELLSDEENEQAEKVH